MRLEEFKTPRGYYSIPSDEWINLTDDAKEYVKSHNGKLRRERDDTNHDGNFLTCAWCTPTTTSPQTITIIQGYISRKKATYHVANALYTLIKYLAKSLHLASFDFFVVTNYSTTISLGRDRE